MKKRWNSSTYAFFHAPTVEYVGAEARRALSFKCAARGCSISVNRFLDKKDSKSTGNLQRHAERCWGADTIRAVKKAKDVEEVREKIVGSLLRDGSITEAFERKSGKVTYSHRPHTRVEARTEFVRWVAESLRPFKIVKDRALLSLLKTGRPGYFVPSPSTVSRDLKVVFARSRNRIAKMLQVEHIQYRITAIEHDLT